jgi:preprotein translocase subunit SecG
MLAAAQTSTVLPGIVVLATGVLGLCLSLALYNEAPTVTMAHEGAHALTAVLMGGRIKRIHLHRGGGGKTSLHAQLDWFGDVLFKAVGYVGPSIFGLIAIFLLGVGDPTIVIWVTIVLLVLMAPFAGEGWWKILVFGVVLYSVVRFGSPDLQLFVALTWIWWLLIGAVVGTSKLVRLLFRGEKETDAHFLRKVTWIPATIWVVVFFAGTVIGLAIGGTQLVAMTS